jgi:hypothetical protein
MRRRASQLRHLRRSDQRLRADKRGEAAVALHECVEAALLDDAPVLENEDAVGTADRR